jgi:hypothetical protein
MASKKSPKSQPAKVSQDRGEAHRKVMAEYSRDQSAAVREIGPPPPIVDQVRRDGCEVSLRLFCETYLAERFTLGWSANHLKVIEKLEQAILKSGMFALAMPRGSGKTTLFEAAVMWAVAYGHRRFVAVIGATLSGAIEILESVKVSFESNDLLFADFPEICYPIRRLEGIAQRASAQIIEGERTRMDWSEQVAVFPTVAGSVSSGSRIRVAGIDGRIRGMKVALPTGETLRPDLALVDDPQTDESAGSLIQIDKNERRLLRAVKGLSGPGKTISVVVTCTVIEPGDLSSRILDRKRHPQFVGELMKLMYAIPPMEPHWDEYARIRRASFDNDGDGSEATEYYREHQSVMDVGAEPAWSERFDPEKEISAIQAAMNLLIDDAPSFWAEYQNTPLANALGEGSRRLQYEWVKQRFSGVPRLTVPLECSRITGFIDPGAYLHWYAIVAWSEQFGGSVIDYGTWPKQNAREFTKEATKSNLANTYKGMTQDEFVINSLQDLWNVVGPREYVQEKTGIPMKPDLFLMDTGYKTTEVYKFIRRVQASSSVKLLPSKGRGRHKDQAPISHWAPKPGQRAGRHWVQTLSETGRGQMIQYDTDEWKSFIYDRIAAQRGSRALLDLYGDSKTDHHLFSTHMTAEYGSLMEWRGREFEKWQPADMETKDRKLNNDWFDCTVGCAVAASVSGLQWTPSASVASTPLANKPISLRDMQEQRRREKERRAV